MGVSKAVGGDRIGSGNKMDVNLHAFESSTHNVTQVTRTTQAVGTVVPIFQRLLLKDNKLELDLNALGYTNPTEGPAFSEYELQIHVYSAPLRLYQAKLHMNILEQGTKMSEIKFPQIKFEADKIDWTRDPDNQQINQSCLYQYLGTRGLGDVLNPATQNTVTRYRNANGLLMYWDVMGNYYCNQQEKIGAVIHLEGIKKNVEEVFLSYLPNDTTTLPEGGGVSETIDMNDFVNIAINDIPGTGRVYQSSVLIMTAAGNIPADDVCNRWEWDGSALIGTEPKLVGVQTFTGWMYDETNTDLEPEVTTFDLSNLNEMRLDVLAAAKQTTPFIIDSNSIAPYGLGLKKYGDTYSKTIAQEGLGLRTYKSDLFNNWLDTEAIEEINERSRIVIDNEGGFTMEQFLLKEKLFSYLNRIQLAGNTVDDWEEAAYGTQSHRPTEKPIFEGGLTKKIYFDEVLSTTPTTDKPLGTMAATGKMGSEHHGGKVSIRVPEASLVMAVASLVPIIDYTQGNDWEGELENYEELHNPNFDKLAFQNLPTDQMATWETKIDATGVKTMYSAGKQPSWIHYQTNVNKDYGEFAKKSSEGWMVNSRSYEADPATRRIKDLTTYVDPAKWNEIFAYKSRTAQNYRMQYLIKAKQRIMMSANQIPGM